MYSIIIGVQTVYMYTTVVSQERQPPSVVLEPSTDEVVSLIVS